MRKELEDALNAHRNRHWRSARKLHQSDKTNADWEREFGVSHRLVGDVLARMQRIDDALASYQNQRGIIERLLRDNEAKFDWQRDLAANHMVVANLLLGRKDLEGAFDSFRKAAALARHLTEIAPTDGGRPPGLLQHSTQSSAQVLNAL